MKNKRGFELAISTLVVIILAVLVLIALSLAFTGGFQKFWNIIKGYSGSEIDAVEKQCQTACDLENAQDFCCREREVDFGNGKEKTTCLDERLNIDCDINCENIC